jgi:hypothetical protein
MHISISFIESKTTENFPPRKKLTIHFHTFNTSSFFWLKWLISNVLSPKKQNLYNYLSNTLSKISLTNILTSYSHFKMKLKLKIYLTINIHSTNPLLFFLDHKVLIGILKITCRFLK